MVALVLVACALLQSGAPRPGPADLIVEGKVFTSALERPWVDAIAVRGEHVAAVGTRAEIEAWRGPETRVLSAGSGVVVPGFNDAHCHFSYAFGLADGVELAPARSLEEILALVAAYAEAHPELEVIEGGGWDLSDMPGETYPTAAMLDAAVDDRPALLWSEGPHGVWVNSAALERAGIDEKTAAPPSTIFVRDASGRPSGTFLGRGLFGLFRFVPFSDLSGTKDGLRRGLAEARRLGVTSVHDPVSPLQLPALVELLDAGELTLRFHVWGQLVAGPFGGGADEHLTQAKTFARGDWITFGTLKGGVDGMPGLRTAALLAPYADDGTTSGILSADPARLAAAVSAANDKGLRVALHATGDRGVRVALDAFLSSKHPELANRIEHAFLVAPEEIERLAGSGVVVSVQPGFLAVDLAKDRYYERRFGPERIGETMPLRALIDQGVVLAFGTDTSLTPLDPLHGIHAAVARRTTAGEPGGGWIPAQRITVEEAVRAYTLGSARAEGAAQRKGTLEPGRLADLVVLSADIFTLPLERLLEVQVVTTIVGGRVVYESRR